MIPKVDHNELMQSIDTYYEANKPLFVKGTTGIGKSMSVKEKAKEMAEETNREFVEWNETTKQEKENVRENIEDHFLFIDIRLSEYEPSDIKGLPDLDGDSVEWKPPQWVRTACLDNAQGFIFLDECNLAPPTVQSAFYQLVLDNQLGEYALASDVYVLGAGNRAGKDNANIHEMAAPLKDRFKHVELEIPEAGEEGNWIEWAMDNDIAGPVVEFLISRQGEDKLFTFTEENRDSDVFATPRSWEDVSDLIKAQGVDSDWDDLEMLVSSAVGKEISSEMGSFLELRDDFDISNIVQNPSEIDKVKNVSVDVKYSLVTGIATEYKHNKDVLENIIDIAQNLDEMGEDEFAVLLLRMAGNYHKNHFKRSVREMDQFEELSEKWFKYFN